MKIKIGKIKSRNYLAIHAHNKVSAGPMLDEKKQKNKTLCRNNDLDFEVEVEYNGDEDESFGDK